MAFECTIPLMHAMDKYIEAWLITIENHGLSAY